MLAVRRGNLILHLIVTVLLIVGLGVFSYLTIRSLPESKSAAERLLMVSVVLALASAVGAVYLYHRSGNLNRSLRQAEYRLRKGEFASREYFSSLGTLGEDLARIYGGLEEISEKKSLRIGALNALNQFLLERSDERLLIINAAGMVFQVSKPFLDGLETRRGTVVGADVTKLLPEFDLDSAIAHFYREGTEIVLESGSAKSTAYPVFDARRELAYFVISLGNEKEVAVPETPTAPSKRSREEGLFRRIRRRFERSDKE